jgi:serine-type D-Ala-D-Ala carboxypeptidase/endopeptidase
MKQIIRSRIDNAGSNAAIVVGLVNSSGAQFYGYGKLSSSNQTTVDKNTIFDIGSITKTFTTTLLADIVDHGIVNLNDPIQKYLPATVKAPTFNNNNRQQPQQITLKDLATHTSGLTDYPANWPLYGVASEKYTIQQMYQALSSVKLTRPPGTEYNYSDFGMGLLGDILASKSGIPYEQLVINEILNPLGMNSTRITLSDTLRSRLATGHFNGQEVNPLLDLPPALAAGGAFRSSASDMVNYLSANMC